MSLNALAGFLCSHPCCWNYEEKILSPHSYINLNKFLWRGIKFPEARADRFENDVEHGVFHGLMTFLVACILDDSLAAKLSSHISQYNENTIRIKHGGEFSKSFFEDRIKTAKTSFGVISKDLKIIPSCLFHDSYKCIFDEHDHAIKLRSYFPDLEESTYHHSNPDKSLSKTLLVRSDRAELMRYKDHHKWVDYDKIFCSTSDDIKRQIEVFYCKIRPVLEKAYEFRRERWIRHGIEKEVLKYEFGPMYPSYIFGFDKNFVIGAETEKKEYWSVHLGLGPDFKCFNNKSIHPWDKVQGKITLQEYKHFTGNELYPCSIRDHLMAKGSLPLNKWIFTHDSLNDAELSRLLESDLKMAYNSILQKTMFSLSKIIDLFYGLKIK